MKRKSKKKGREKHNKKIYFPNLCAKRDNKKVVPKGPAEFKKLIKVQKAGFVGLHIRKNV